MNRIKRQDVMNSAARVRMTFPVERTLDLFIKDIETLCREPFDREALHLLRLSYERAQTTHREYFD
jgi:hypothetical protein